MESDLRRPSAVKYGLPMRFIFRFFSPPIQAVRVNTITNADNSIKKNFGVRALGMVNEGDDVVTVAERIMSYAPSAALKELPVDATLEDKAMLLLEGKV